METDIKFDALGIAEVLSRFRLRVPLNQREYSWEEGQVGDLLRDIHNSLGKKAYFLGTIVVTTGIRGVLEVADGQQRLATTTMILAFIRDFYLKTGDLSRSDAIESKFLLDTDIDSGEKTQRLTLNSDDNTFFFGKILARPGDRKKLEPLRKSHNLMRDAFTQINEFFEEVRSSHGDRGFADVLKDWRLFLIDNAKIILLRAPNALNAFLMFQTLNARGLKTSQADLVKNHLFEQATSDRIDEAQNYWSSMRGVIESTGDDDLILDYLRHACCVFYGHTREKEIFERVEGAVKNSTSSVQFLHQLSDLSENYCALLNPEHLKWRGYDPAIRGLIRTLLLLNVSQMRPLMLAVSERFTPKRALVAFDRFVSWAVRFIVSGGGRGGAVEKFYDNLAHQVFTKAITKPEELDEKATKTVPTDAQFKDRFSTVSLEKAHVNRYLLRSLEFASEGKAHPGWTPIDGTDITLEHIMPATLCPEKWPHATQQIIDTHSNRLGNLALLPGTINVKVDRESFDVKKRAYSQSGYGFTQQIATAPKWDTEAIETRQKSMSDFAIKTWKIG